MELYKFGIFEKRNRSFLENNHYLDPVAMNTFA